MTRTDGSASERLLALEAQMRVLGRRIRRVAAERAAAVDPSLGEVSYAVIEFLHRSDESRQRDLVTGLCIEKAAVSRAVTQLVELGLVERGADPDDGRGHVLTLSTVGRRRISAVLADRRAEYTAKLAGWSTAEIEAFVGMLEHYNAAVEGAGSPTPEDGTTDE